MLKYISYIILATLLVSCELNQKDVEPTDNFVKIYNNPDENLAYYVESVFELNDGYLVLSGIKNASENLNEYPLTSVIRSNELGEVQWSQEYAWRSPNKNIVEFNGEVGFVAMNNGDDAYFIAIDAESGAEKSSTSLNLSMPLSAYVNAQGNLIVLSYDYISWSSIITVFSPGFGVVSSQRFAVGEDLVVAVQKHLNKSGTEFPFFIGDWSNSSLSGFYVNCLYNYTQGVLFFGNDGTSTGGWIYSHQIENAISSLLHKEEDIYGLTRYFNNTNFINPSVNVDVTSLQNFNDSTQNPMHNLVPNAPVSSVIATFGGADYALYASTTNSNSVIIYQYTLDTDELYHEVEVEFASKIEVKQILQDTKDNGIIVLAQHYVTGKYLRPVLIKIPVRDFKE